MSRVHIEFDTDNAAFEDDGEIERVLKRAAMLLTRSSESGRMRLQDSNGNTVGFCRFAAQVEPQQTVYIVSRDTGEGMSVYAVYKTLTGADHCAAGLREEYEKAYNNGQPAAWAVESSVKGYVRSWTRYGVTIVVESPEVMA